MQMTERDRNENEMHIIKEEARRQRDEPQSRWPKGLCQNSSRWDGTEYHVKTGGQGVAQGEKETRGRLTKLAPAFLCHPMEVRAVRAYTVAAGILLYPGRIDYISNAPHVWQIPVLEVYMLLPLN